MIISMIMHKGGVGKTTTTWNLAAAFYLLGKKVLAIDLDPQASLTKCQGINPADLLGRNMHDVINGSININTAVLKLAKYKFLGSTFLLSGSEVDLMHKIGKEFFLQKRIRDLNEKFDHILIDCRPDLGHLTINALTASDLVIIPLQCEFLAYAGLGQISTTISQIENLKGAKIPVIILPTMYDGRTKHSKDVVEQLTSDYENKKGYPVFPTVVKNSVKFADSAANAKDIFDFSGKEFEGAAVYTKLAQHIDGGNLNG